MTGPGTELLRWDIHIATENITIEWQNYTIPANDEELNMILAPVDIPATPEVNPEWPPHFPWYLKDIQKSEPVTPFQNFFNGLYLTDPETKRKPPKEWLETRPSKKRERVRSIDPIPEKRPRATTPKMMTIEEQRKSFQKDIELLNARTKKKENKKTDDS